MANVKIKALQTLKHKGEYVQPNEEFSCAAGLAKELIQTGLACRPGEEVEVPTAAEIPGGDGDDPAGQGPGAGE